MKEQSHCLRQHIKTLQRCLVEVDRKWRMGEIAVGIYDDVVGFEGSSGEKGAECFISVINAYAR